MNIRTMTAADLPFADSLRATVGWNQTLDDWRRFLALEPEGCFVAEKEGRPAGVATTTTYEGKVAWIGMVLVHPDARGQGIGKGLLHHCVDFLRARNIACIKLDATPAGQPLYEKIGFLPEWELSRWEGRIVKTPVQLSVGDGAATSPGVETALPARNPEAGRTLLHRLQKLDRRAFGVSRQPLLEAIFAQAECLAWVPGNSNENVEAYGALRKGTRAHYLGPAAAGHSTAGLAVAKELLRRSAGQPLFWDIPEAQIEAIALAKSLGLKRQRRLLRMYLGENHPAGDATLQLALADPAVG